MSDMLRITGMASGLDVESMVKTLMKAENVRLDKVKQDKQRIQWKQEAYRDIVGDINLFKSTYFDVLKSDTYMLSSNAYAGFDVATVPSVAPSVTAIAGAGAAQGSYKVEVTQLAAGASIVGNKIAGNATRTTKLTDLNPALKDKVSFTLTYNGGAGVPIEIDNTSGDKTITDVINAVSSATSGNVVAKYSELTGAFTLQTAKTGSAANINATDGALGLLNSLGLGGAVPTNGIDSALKITPPGGAAIDVTKSTNNFLIDGINFSLNNVGTTTLNVNSNSQKTFDKIKGIIGKYNEIIDKINTKITEKTAKGFKPLTEEQKKEMKDEEIKAWEARAKEGLLRGDNDLQSMLHRMRSAFFDTVKGAGVSLKEIGLDTSPDISQGGKIIIDESKLKNAIETKGNQVIDIFVKASSTAYNPDGANTTRYGEEGILQRINDIMMDYTRSTRNTNGKKGALIEKAGIKGTLSEFNNLLSKQITDKEKMINDLTRKLSDKENSYYIKFSKLEQAMQNSNSQSSWLSQQLGGSQ